MKIEFDLNLKQRLAAELGGTLVENNSALTLARGRDQLKIEFTGHLQGERRLGFRVRSGLERAEKHGAGAGYRQDPRPRLDGQPGLLLRRETAKDRKGKRWGLNREIQTADPQFDELVYVQSDAPDEHLQAVLGSAETRRIVKTLLERHCESVGINQEDLEAVGTHRAAGELVVEYRTYEPDEASPPGGGPPQVQLRPGVRCRTAPSGQAKILQRGHQGPRLLCRQTGDDRLGGRPRGVLGLGVGGRGSAAQIEAPS